MSDRSPPAPRILSLPGLRPRADVGVGTLLARATSALGVPACAGCQRRAAALDRRWVVRGREPASRVVRPPQ